MKKYLVRASLLAMLWVMTGCSSYLVKDDTKRSTLDTAHCAGSTVADDSTLAILPVPIVAFLMPHVDLNDIKADDYLKRCGDSTKLINREVEVSRGACLPTAVTRIISLGVWQWCPASVSWQADVMN